MRSRHSSLMAIIYSWIVESTRMVIAYEHMLDDKAS